MNENLKLLLEKFSTGLLDEAAYSEINDAFESVINERVEIAVKAREEAIDAEYANNLETLVEAIDLNHGKKLIDALDKVESKYTDKLKLVINKYEEVIGEKAASFSENLLTVVSDFIDIQLESLVPYSDIKTIVENKQNEATLQKIKNIVGLDSAIEQPIIKEAVIDANNTINSLKSELDKTKKLLSESTDKQNRIEAEKVISEKLEGTGSVKSKYIRNTFKGKSAEYINENFEYVSKLFDKRENEIDEKIRNKTVPLSRDAEVITESFNDDTDESTSVYDELFHD